MLRAGNYMYSFLFNSIGILSPTNQHNYQQLLAATTPAATSLKQALQVLLSSPLSMDNRKRFLVTKIDLLSLLT
jgi:hypothetical protein